ncbi:hypothetical protein [Streptomyces sp. NPDC056937]|uniref:hypothetical protein n=1 Tax=Streptomyces sp. NPDC056937 TaxID=3345969 RepID=UPI00362D2768
MAPQRPTTNAGQPALFEISRPSAGSLLIAGALMVEAAHLAGQAPAEAAALAVAVAALVALGKECVRRVRDAGTGLPGVPAVGRVPESAVAVTVVIVTVAAALAEESARR